MVGTKTYAAQVGEATQRLRPAEFVCGRCVSPHALRGAACRDASLVCRSRLCIIGWHRRRSCCNKTVRRRPFARLRGWAVCVQLVFRVIVGPGQAAGRVISSTWALGLLRIQPPTKDGARGPRRGLAARQDVGEENPAGLMKKQVGSDQGSASLVRLRGWPRTRRRSPM